MDRAHRIGQKKVVNVYRIVTRGTLEEKILKYVYLSIHTTIPEKRFANMNLPTVSNVSRLTSPLLS